MTETIAVESAMTLASNEASRIWGNLAKQQGKPLLDDEVREAEACWLFVRHRDIVIPNPPRAYDCMIVVSRRGSVRIVADFYGDREKQAAYLKMMSEHFKKLGE